MITTFSAHPSNKIMGGAGSAGDSELVPLRSFLLQHVIFLPELNEYSRLVCCTQVRLKRRKGSEVGKALSLCYIVLDCRWRGAGAYRVCENSGFHRLCLQARCSASTNKELLPSMTWSSLQMQLVEGMQRLNPSQTWEALRCHHSCFGNSPPQVFIGRGETLVLGARFIVKNTWKTVEKYIFNQNESKESCGFTLMDGHPVWICAASPLTSGVCGGSCLLFCKHVCIFWRHFLRNVSV